DLHDPGCRNHRRLRRTLHERRLAALRNAVGAAGPPAEPEGQCWAEVLRGGAQRPVLRWGQPPRSSPSAAVVPAGLLPPTLLQRRFMQLVASRERLTDSV